MKEEWKDIKGYEGLYQISSYGRVYSFYKKGYLELNLNKYGYLHVGLYREGKRKVYKVHRLVAQTFILNPNNYPEVNHKDENKINNYISNLEWCTHQYNNFYGTKNIRQSNKSKGRKLTQKHKDNISKSLKGDKNPFYGKHHTEETKKKISNTRKEEYLFKGSRNPRAHKVQCITTGKKFNTIKEASEYYYVDRHYITSNCKDNSKYGGKHPVTGEKLVWKYLDGK